MSNSDEIKLTMSYKNEAPVELTDMTTSLLALSNQYDRYIKKSGPKIKTGKLRLYVKEVRQGSTIFDIFSSPDALVMASYVSSQIPMNFIENSLAAIKFSKWWGNFLGYFMGITKKKPKDIERQDLENGLQFLEVAAKDCGGTNSLIAYRNQTVVNQFVFNSNQANAGQNAIKRELDKAPTTKDRNNVILRLDQGRNSSHTNGNYGKIEAVDPSRTKLHFKDKAIKNRVLNCSSNPFARFYLVDAEIHQSELKDSPVLYVIKNVHEDWPIDDD